MPQQQQVPADQRDCKVKDPELFSGDPKDLERFLLQVDNKFEMEPNRFRNDVQKIRNAGQLMKDRAHKWYRAYHLQISERDATRVRGPINLDPRYADWDRFEATFKATFGERVTREQATIEWEKLRDTSSIDDFVDEITRLMWITGYKGYTVEDKIRNVLNDVMVVEWAQVAQKPREVGEQLALLQDIGHSMEDALKQSSTQYKLRGGGSHKPNHSHDKEKGGKGGEKGKSKGKKGGQQKGKTQSSKDWKDRNEHLRASRRICWRKGGRLISVRSVARATTSGLSAMPRQQSFLVSLGPREAAIRGGQTRPPRSKSLRRLRL